MRGYSHEEKNSTPKIHPRSARACHPATRRSPRTASFRLGCHPGVGCNPETLRAWYRKHQDAQNPAAVAQQAQDARIKALERENYELKRSNEILRKAAAFFAQAELDRKPK